MSCNILKLLARPRRFERPTFAFGGQRSIQLSYGRLWASIDQTPASGNALDIAGYCSIGLCVKAPAAKFGRSNRLGRASSSRAAGVPDGICRWRFSAAHPSVVGMSAIGVRADKAGFWSAMVCQLLTLSGHWLCTAAMFLMPVSAPIKVLV